MRRRWRWRCTYQRGCDVPERIGRKMEMEEVGGERKSQR
jgi:hypothetical protein